MKEYKITTKNNTSNNMNTELGKINLKLILKNW